ncbi:MAG: ATP-binding protein [Trebonia sp.]
MSSALYGRDAQARAVLALLDGARAGRSGALVVRGEAGIGKTALLGLAECAAVGMTVLRGTAIETEAELPFAGLHLLLRAWRRGDHETALARSASFTAECRERGMAGWLAGALHCQGLSEAARGDWPAARATLLEGLRLAADIGRPVRASHAAALLAVLAATEGDEPACRSWLAAFRREDISGDAWGYGAALPALIELGRGRFGAALAGFRVLQAGGKWRADTAFWYQPYLTEAAARGGDPAWAAQTATVFCAWAADTGQPWALAVAARCRGLTKASRSRSSPRPCAGTPRPAAARLRPPAPISSTASGCAGRSAGPRPPSSSPAPSGPSTSWARSPGPSGPGPNSPRWARPRRARRRQESWPG